MSDVYSDIYQSQYVDVPPTEVKGSVAGGHLKRYVAKYEADALDADSVIRVCRPRKGERLSGLSLVHFDDLDASTDAKMNVGTGITGAAVAADPDKFALDIDVSTAAGHANLNLIGGVDYEFDGKTDIIATPTGHAITGTLVFEVVVAAYN